MTSVLNNMQYTLSDVDKIKSLDNKYIIADDIIQIINSISDKVGAPSYVKTPIFHKKKQEDRKKKKRNLEINDEDWVAIRNFQATEKIKKEGVEKLIDTIRCELNKISDKHYEKQKNKILELMSELSKGEYSDEDKNKVVALIFEIASNNKFYSKLYAQLYKDLTTEEKQFTNHRDYKKIFLRMAEEAEKLRLNENLMVYDFLNIFQRYNETIYQDQIHINYKGNEIMALNLKNILILNKIIKKKD